MQTTYEIRVMEEDIDSLGHVNYNKYISFSERAMGDWHEKIGLNWEEMARRKMGTVVVNINISYIKEARLGEVLKVITIPEKLGTKSFVITQEIYNQRNERITEITKKFVMFDISKREGIVVIDEIARNFK